MRHVLFLCLLAALSSSAAAQSSSGSQTTYLLASAAAVAGEGTTSSAPVQPVVIRGYVVGADGQALAGVTAAVPGTRALAVSNAAGEFLLTVPGGNGPVQLTCSYLGLDDYRVAVDPAHPELRIEMSKSPKLLTIIGRPRDL